MQNAVDHGPSGHPEGMRISAYGFSIAIEIGIEAFGQSVWADSISIPIWISTSGEFLEFSELNE
jgi:hypothetical protein